MAKKRGVSSQDAVRRYDPRLNASDVDQLMFPGAYIEPEWMRPELLNYAANYAIRILLGAQIEMSAGGNSDYVSMALNGTEYVIHKTNYEAAEKIAMYCYTEFLLPLGFQPQTIKMVLLTDPNLLIDSIKWMRQRIIHEYSVPENMARIFFISGDAGACSAFRSEYPYKHFRSTSSIKDDLFLQRSQVISLANLNYFDSVMVHRCPSAPMLKVLRSLKRAGKHIIYETDDDIFNIPEFNINSSMIDQDDLERIAEVMRMADVIVTTNEYLRSKIGYPDKTLICPNLIPIEKYSQIKKTRVLNKYLTGVQCRKENGKIRLVKTKTGSYLPNGIDLLNPNVYDPIRVLWMGSNTHDGDLECIVPVVKEIGKRYGLAVRFVFFGYCPDEFIYNTMDRGNIHTGMAVKDEYQSFVDYVQGVSHEHYHKVFNKIKSDIGICPLSEHEFNLSKSNIKPLELGARRIPSIVTDFGPYQFIQNRVNGIKVKNKTEEWVNALAELIEDVHTRIRLGDAILSTVSQDYSWSSDCVGRQMWDEAFKLCRSQMLAIRTQKQEEFNNSPIRTTDED